MEKIFEVKGLSKAYKNNRGIRDISFDVFKGEIFGFLGPNGAGKTTTMKAAAGLLRADAGEVKISGRDIGTDYENAMAKVGCIIEKVEAYEYLSAYSNLVMATRLYPGIDKSRIDEVFELVGLDKYKRDKVADYSYGMKQRLGLAGALLHRPELVILDEPANGLDIEGTMSIRNIITTLAREQKVAFFISSHLVREMEVTCDRVGIIYEGRLGATGIVKDLLENYKSLENFFVAQINKNREVAS